MTIAADINQIALRAGMTTPTQQDVGLQKPIETLRSYTELSFAQDGVYYNKALNTIVITKDGTTLDGFNFSGVVVNVQANDVTFKNSYFDASIGSYSINALPGSKNLTVENSTFDGLKIDKSWYNDFIFSRGENTVIKNNEFLNAPNDAISLMGGEISGNIISGGGYASNAHSDAIWIGSTNGPVVITNNIIDWRPSADAPASTNNAIRITGELGSVDNVTITKNVILGGTASVLVTDGATYTHSASEVGTVTNVKVIDNVIDYSQFYDLYPTARPSDLVYQNNHHASGVPISAGIEAVGIVPSQTSMNVVASTNPNANLFGGAGSDYIIGGSGNNAIYGGDGDDVIYGGAGRDYLTGGGGKNIFYYNSLKDSGIDYIYDFKHGTDKIALSDLDGAPKSADGWQWLGSESFTGNPWQLRVIQTSTLTTIQLDADGDLKADFQLTFKGSITITTGDFILAAKATAPVAVKPIELPAAVVIPNALPTICGVTTGSIVHGVSCAANGTLSFADDDSANVLTTSIKSFEMKFIDAAGADHSAWLNSANIQALKAGFAFSSGSLGGASGSADWSYDTAKTDLSFLGEGDTAQITTKVQVDDGAGGLKYQDVVVTVTGVNDGPVITGSSAITVAETANLSYSDATMIREGSISFGDVDLSDVHSVTVLKAANARGYRGNFSATIGEDSTGTGKGTIKWTFDTPEKSLDYLAVGQTLTQIYTVELTDSHGAKTTTDITLTIVGTNDKPVISGPTTATLWESNAPTLSVQKSLALFDADLTDTLATSISSQTLKLVTASGVDMTSYMTPTEIAQLKEAFHFDPANLGSNKGTGVWSYLIDNSSLDFLGQNDTLTVTNTIKVDDGHGGVAYQDVTVNLRGVNDAPVFDSHKAGDAAITGTVKEMADTSGSAAVLQSNGKIGFSDIDISDSHTVRVAPKAGGYMGTLTASISHDTTGGDAGEVVWSFKVADGALDKLGAGQTVKQVYTVSVSDGKSGMVSQDITINLTGSSDTFVFQNTTTKTLSNFAAGDLIGVNANTFGGNLHSGDLLNNYFSQGTAPTEAGHGQFYQDASHKTLYWDADGTGSGSAVVIAKFASAVDLHASDLFVL